MRLLAVAIYVKDTKRKQFTTDLGDYAVKPSLLRYMSKKNIDIHISRKQVPNNEYFE